LIARATALLLMLACLAPSPAMSQPATSPESEVKVAVEAIYARYRGSPLAGGPADDSTRYTSRTAALIARWHSGQPEDEVTPLGDFDWFCQCQDYDEKSFAITALTVRKGRAGAYEAAIAYDLGWGSKAQLRLILIREQGDWKVDDILFARDTGVGTLRAGLAAEVRDFDKRPRSTPGERP
jgi:hypothetical protein